MGKKKSKKIEAPKLSKKELKAREAALEAEIERREKKAAKKALKKSDESNAAAAKKSKKGKKGKAPKPLDVEPMTITAEAEAHVDPGEPTPEEAAVERDRSKPLSGKALKKALEADTQAALERKAQADAEDAEIKARVQAKRAARAAAAEAVKTDEAGPTPSEKRQKMQAEVAADHGEKVKARMKSTSSNVDKGGLVADAEAHAVAAAAEAVKALQHATEIVETEHGREFAVGVSVAATAEEEFAKPSDAPRDLESGRNGYKIIQLGADGKPDLKKDGTPRTVRQMTRITTFVKNIDDETNLKKWEKRLLAEGIAADAAASGVDPERGVPLFAQVNDIVHRREVKISKAIKADRKGKLGIGEVGRIVELAEKEAKDAIDQIVEAAVMLAGRNDKANFGSHLHTLAEISDSEGIDAVRKLHESGELVAHDNDGVNDGLEPMPVTATDLASIEAYAARMSRLGAKVLYSEAVVVNDELGNAGRLDRILMAKLPELVVGRGTPEEYTRPADTRARRYVADLKSGSLEYGAGQIARQLSAYALADLYDLETGERTSHRAARDIALVFHLPLGEGTCSVYAVDLKAGIRLLKLSADVRRARNTGKKTIDLTVDIADPAAESDETTEEAVAS